MWKELFLDEDHQIFQTQLVALLKKKVDFNTAVGMIEAKASTRLKHKIQSAGQPLLPGLVHEGLLSPELAALLGRTAPTGVDAAAYLHRSLDDEVEAGRIDLQIRGQFSRVFLLFGVTTVVALVINEFFAAVIGPGLNSMAENYGITGQTSPPYAWVSSLLFWSSALAMFGFLAALGSIFLALSLDGYRQRNTFRFLWKIPFVGSIFRKRATRRVLAHLSSLRAAGADTETAVGTSLAELGLRAGSGQAPLPSSPFLDPLSVEAVNLGAALDTFDVQLDTMLALLRQEIPYSAQKVTRIIYYVGYVVLGLLVGSLLVQLYGPILRMAAPLL
jgi:hypothetical protein